MPANAPASADRLNVLKTYKLFVDGKFPRSESGRTIEVKSDGQTTHLCRGSRKDLRDAVSAARKAQVGWRNATAYLRGQILYRAAEMLEGRREEFRSLLVSASGAGAAKGAKGKKGPDEFGAAVDRLVHFAGWCDKAMQVLGNANPVAGPFYNFTVPQPTGVVAVIAPDSPALLGLVSLLAPVIAGGNAAAVIAGEGAAGVVASVFAEVLATSDLPGGVVNILTGVREELVPVVASHRDIDAVHAAAGKGACTAEQAAALRAGSAENLKRVKIVDLAPAAWFDAETCEGPWWIEPFVEMKTMWHPSAT